MKEVTLKKELKDHLDAIGVEDVRTVSKWSWKKKVKDYIKKKQKDELLQDIKMYKKLDYEELSKDSYERKPFLSTLSLESARMKYKILSKVVPTIRSHFPRRYRSESLLCPGCSEEQLGQSGVKDFDRNSETHRKDSVTHILLYCDAYKDLQSDNFDPSDDRKLSEFFTQVVQRRIERGED